MINSGICFVLAACLCHQAASQFASAPAQPPTTQSSVNASAANASALANQAPITQFFAQVLDNQVYGLKKCKKPKDCGLGLKCDILLNLCVPFNAPIFSDIEKTCTNESECSGMHSCQSGLCRFCGPKSCRSNLDCCAGSFAEGGNPGRFYECLNIADSEKLSLAKQLGRVPANYQPIPKAAGGRSEEYEVESSELIQLGIRPAVGGKNPFHGKRCWARCNVDNDCYHQGTPAHVKQQIGCCNNVCNSKSACAVLSPQVVAHAQQLQQQRLQQQQAFAQQQALLSQAHPAGHLHHQHAAQQSQWGAAGHGQQYVAPSAAQPQPYVVYAQPVPVAVAPVKPVPHSWQEAQGPALAVGVASAPQTWQQALQSPPQQPQAARRAF